MTLTAVIRLDGTIDQLENEYEDVTRSLNLAKAEADSLNAAILAPDVDRLPDANVGDPHRSRRPARRTAVAGAVHREGRRS